MSYQVLARKYRPGDFSTLVGQEAVVKALMHSLSSQRLHHAYLFTGTRGVGKTTIARILAKALNCETGVTATPCGQCGSCLEISQGRFPDLIELDAASRTGVDSTRELIDNAQYLPTRGRYKVYIIDEVHMLSTSSFNALLKTLEEPPAHVKFLLATTDPKKIPVTVLSRCLQFQLRNLLPEKISAYLAEILTQETISFEPPALTLIAKAARGSMRDALSLTDQALVFGAGQVQTETVASMLGALDDDLVLQLLEQVASGDGATLLALCDEMSAQAVEFAEVIASLLSLCHDLAIQQALGTTSMPPRLQALAQRLQPETVQLYYQILLLGLRDMTLAPDPRCGFDMVMLRLLNFTPVPPPTADAAGPIGGARPKQGAASTEPVPSTAPATPAASATTMEEVTPVLVTTPVTVPAEVAHWYSLLPQLQLVGVTRVLAEHTVPVQVAANQWTLCLDPQHDTLLGDSHVQTIARALSETLGRELQVIINVAPPPHATPAQRTAQLQQARQAQALAELQADPHVQTLMAEFAAHLHPDSVKPLGSPPGN